MKSETKDVLFMISELIIIALLGMATAVVASKQDFFHWPLIVTALLGILAGAVISLLSMAVFRLIYKDRGRTL